MGSEATEHDNLYFVRHSRIQRGVDAQPPERSLHPLGKLHPSAKFCTPMKKSKYDQFNLYYNLNSGDFYVCLFVLYPRMQFKIFVQKFKDVAMDNERY